jgi:GNAT superfamily N-acetyltransferase
VLPDFSPLDLDEFRALARSLRPLLDPDLALVAEIDGKVVGFALGLPNLNEALIHVGGLRYPWDYARFALACRRITGASFKILAIDPDFWGYGLDAVMFVEMGRAVIRRGYRWVDGSLTGTDNPQTNKLATRLGAVVYRRYRQYRLRL